MRHIKCSQSSTSPDGLSHMLKLKRITTKSNVPKSKKNSIVVKVVPYDPKNATGILKSLRTTGDCPELTEA